ncbi:hypothetical protein [Fluviicola taffensis]|uniref:Uncharacterized protein n=1 Tax=Fluviicola taffensis (strain DSM 16823 / NCIMB 13979 / RW262) TaxID=755732 RepID=F2IJU1_FLUTR|nr:hypothetical protein [Fluviicola taffensis]AEA45000.1 hypothetical protein Fluta_3021 [Fluviicola taffensis DSM 16823]
MKTYFITLLIVLCISGTNAAKAQTSLEISKTEQSIKKNGKYAMLVMKAQHLKAAIITGKEFKAKSPNIDFQVVICGELVKEISADSLLQALVLEAIQNKEVKFLFCGLSISQLKIDKNTLPKEVPITDNGLIYLFGLQEHGYKTIIL